MKKTDYTSHEVCSFDQLLKLRKQFCRGWIFRGAKGPDLKTSLEKACDRFKIDLQHDKGLRKGQGSPKLEQKLILEFKRRYHFYARYVPRDNDYLEWLALMQHHGAPTRLLDWTYSLFVATYFAIAESHPTETEKSVIWALDSCWMEKCAKSVVGEKLIEDFDRNRSGESFVNLFMNKSPKRFVFTSNPTKFNERLTMQQGLFLCPGNAYEPFEANLLEFNNVKKHLHGIMICKECQHDIIWELARMNIDRATLFPGLDGFAHSLKTRIKALNDTPMLLPDLYGCFS